MKRLLFTLLMTLYTLFGYSQNGWLATTALPGEIDITIIRQYQDDYSISYIRTTEGCYFAWSDNQTVIKLVEISSDYRVMDFEIIADTVCFCGSYNPYPVAYGFVGWFSVPDLFFGNGDYHVFDYYFQTLSPDQASPFPSYVIIFNDLTIFDNMEDPYGRIHIALVGDNARSESCVAELKGFFMPNTWTYTTGTADKIEGTLNQVVETDNYIVVAGVMPDETSTSLRMFYKTAMFIGSPLLCDNIQRYTSSTLQPCFYPMGHFKMTALDGDTIATLSLFHEYSYPNSDGFVLHIINATDALYNSQGSPCFNNQYVNVFNVAGYCNVNRLTYSSISNTLAGLVTSNNPLTGNTSLMVEQTSPFLASMDYFSRGGYKFFDHDKFFAQLGYIAIGKNESTLSELAIFARHIGLTNVSTCGYGANTMTQRNNFTLRRHNSPLGIASNSFSFENLVPIRQFDLNLTQICIEQQ